MKVLVIIAVLLSAMVNTVVKAVDTTTTNYHGNTATAQDGMTDGTNNTISEAIYTMKTDFSIFEKNNRYVTFTEGLAKKLVVTGWEIVKISFGEDQTPKNALRLQVVAEDGKPCDPVKELTASNYTLINGLRPLIEEAEKAGVGELKVIVTRFGTGKGTKYVVMKD